MGSPLRYLARELAVGLAAKAELTITNDDQITIEVAIFPHVDNREPMRPGIGPVPHEVGVGRTQDRRHITHLLLSLIDGIRPAKCTVDGVWVGG